MEIGDIIDGSTVVEILCPPSTRGIKAWRLSTVVEILCPPSTGRICSSFLIYSSRNFMSPFNIKIKLWGSVSTVVEILCPPSTARRLDRAGNLQ